MSSENYPVQQRGIYHNLPAFDPKITGLNAIVTGANGISGFATMQVLLESPERWAKVYALSRRPPPEEMMQLLTEQQRSRVKHVACDFLESPDKIAEAMKGIQATHVFFYSYLQPKPPPGAAAWSNAEELVKVNSSLFSNFLDALPKAGINPKRIVLQTGAKNYGVHIGRSRAPAVESDPQPKHLEPNFYYPQEERLFKYCKENSETHWNVIRPAWIIGAVSNAQMNALHPWGVYAAVQAKKGESLQYGGDIEDWEAVLFHSTARLTGFLTEWAALEEKCQNEAFNSTDTSNFTMDRFLEELNRWYGAGGVTRPVEDESAYHKIVGKSGKDTPLGYGPPTVMKSSFSLSQWAQDSENARIWQEIMKESNGKLTHNPFDDVVAHFTFGDAVGLGMTLSMNKARRLGWTGFVDTTESVFEMYEGMEKLGMLPPMKVDKAKPYV